jgi:hypothetical protein
MKTINTQSASVRRIVKIQLDNTSCLGAWEVICDGCPLKPHLDALGMKPKACAAGIQTNIQGVLPLSKCEHYENDSINGDGDKLTIVCRKRD